ncbi:TolC family protein [Leptothoe kymatousa]|nr:TolC family protein [Leptothoe kymatousa]
MAVLGGALSLLPFPALAKALAEDSATSSESVTSAAVQVAAVPSEELLSDADVSASDSQVSVNVVTPNVLAPADVTLASPKFSKTSPTHVRAILPAEVNQLTQLPQASEVSPLAQLPDLPTDEPPENNPVGEEPVGEEPVPSVDAVEEPLLEQTGDISTEDAVDVEVPSSEPEIDATSSEPEAEAPLVEPETEAPEVAAPIENQGIVEGEIVPETGQAPSTAEEDLLDQTDLPPTELLADPNPLTVPTLESEVKLVEGAEQTVSLEEALELAYFNNQDLQVALLQLEQAEASLDQAEAAFSPSAFVQGSLTRTTTPGPFGEDNGLGTETDTQLNINPLRAEYDIFTSGQRKATVRAAEEQVRLQELEVTRRREELRLQTTTLYYDLQESGEQIRINQSFVEEAQRNQRDNELRRQAGVGTRFDVLRADVQLANAQQNLIQSRSQQQIARRNLARLLNVPSTVNLKATLVPAPDNWETTYERWSLTLEDSILLAFQSRVELEQQLAQREIGLQQARAARAANGPQLTVFAQYSGEDVLGSTRDGLGAPNEGFDFFDTDRYQLGLQFSMVLTDGGAARAQARQQEANAAIAEERFSEQLDQIRFDVEQAYFTLRANEENVRTARTAIEQAETALELANLRLDAGVGTQLDVLTAQSELTQAEGNWVSAALGYNRALASLQRAVSNLRATS